MSLPSRFASSKAWLLRGFHRRGVLGAGKVARVENFDFEKNS